MVDVVWLGDSGEDREFHSRSDLSPADLIVQARARWASNVLDGVSNDRTKELTHSSRHTLQETGIRIENIRSSRNAHDPFGFESCDYIS